MSRRVLIGGTTIALAGLAAAIARHLAAADRIESSLDVGARASRGNGNPESATSTNRTTSPPLADNPIASATRIGRVGSIAGLAARSTARRTVMKARGVAASQQRRAELEDTYAMRTAADVAQQLGQMRGVLMKVGQMVSFMFDSLPESTRAALASLQESAPPMSPSLAASMVYDELGEAPEEVFSEWQAEPVAAASIGQVHRAVTKTGVEVAVKVQYPGLEEAIAADLSNTELLYALLGRRFSALDTASLVEEFSERITEELDYEHECANQMEFHRVFARHPWARVPRAYPEYSARRVLSTDWIDGMRFAEHVDTSPVQLKRRSAEVVWRFSQHSIHRHLFFNGDPHPGNYRFHQDGTVSFLDYGMVKRWEPDEWQRLRATMAAVIVDRDADAICEAMRYSGFLGADTAPDTERIARYVSAPYEPYLSDEFHFTPEWFADALGRATAVGNENAEVTKSLNIPPSFLLLNRVVWGINALMSKLDAYGPFRAMLMEYIADGPPATEMGADELEWRRSHHPSN